MAGGVELPEVSAGAAAETIFVGVAGEAVEGTLLAAESGRVSVVALGTAGVAHLVGPHEVSGPAGSAEGEGGAGGAG